MRVMRLCPLVPGPKDGMRLRTLGTLLAPFAIIRGMTRHLRLLVVAGLSMFAMAAFSEDIGPGSKAPPLAIKTWIKGTPVPRLEANKTYVVEFWATWCGPCIESIPHLTELAKKNKDVTFIGVSIWEDDKDGNIQKFVGDMGEKMDYAVAYSGNKDGMAETWMKAAGQIGIPTAFVVKGGKIAWVGHPMELDVPLAQIKAGTFDSKAFKAQFDKSAAANREQMAVTSESLASVKMFDSGKRAEAKKMLDATVAKHPTAKASAERTRFNWLSIEDPQAWEALATEMAGSKDNDKVMLLCSFAYREMTREKGRIEQGRRALELALLAGDGKDFGVLEYAAQCYTATREYKLALEMVNRQLQLLPTTPYKDNAEYKQNLENQKADLEARLKGS